MLVVLCDTLPSQKALPMAQVQSQSPNRTQMVEPVSRSTWDEFQKASTSKLAEVLLLNLTSQRRDRYMSIVPWSECYSVAISGGQAARTSHSGGAEEGDRILRAVRQEPRRHSLPLGGQGLPS